MSASATRAARKIRYSDNEWDSIVERARACGRAPARYVREVSLGFTLKTSRALMTAPLVHELGRIGNVLAAIRSDLRTLGDAPRAERVDAALEELLAVVRRVD